MNALNLGRDLKDFVTPYFGLFQDENVAPAIAAWMGVAALTLLLIFLGLVARSWLRIRDPVRFVKACKDRADFASKFGAFDAKMMGSKLFSHGWSEYTKTLLQKEGNVIESTVRPADFINLTELEHTLRLKWFHNIPSTFVGFGLLFTFVGLVAALYFASQAIHAVGDGNVDAAQQTIKMQGALAKLLSAATFKFWTSIVGLGSSIILGVSYRISVRSLDAQLDTLCCEIERCTLTVTTEMLASRQLNELREQSTQLKEFTGQLAFNLGKSLEEALHSAMPGVMNTAMSPVAEKLDSMTQNFANMNENAIQTMTQEFGSVMSTHAGSEIRGASEAMNKVKDALLETSKVVAGSGSGLSGQITEAAADLRAAAKAITEGMSGITSTVQNDVDKTRDTLDAQLQAATAGLTNMAEIIQASLAGVGKGMRDSTHEAGTLFTQQVADAVARIETGTLAMTHETHAVVQAMRATSEQMAQSVATITGQIRQGASEGVTELTERLVTAAEVMQEASNKNSEHIGQAVERIIAAGSEAEIGVGKAAAKVVSGTDQVLTQFKESMNKIGLAMDAVEGKIGLHIQALDGVNRAARETEGSLTESAKMLVEAGKPLEQATQTLRESIDNSTKSVETTAKVLDETHRQSTTLSKELTSTVQELQTIWSRHAGRFDRADKNLGDAFAKIKDIVDYNTTKLEEHVRAIDTGLAETVHLLAGNIEELSEMVSEFSEVSRKFGDATKSLERVATEPRR